MQSSSVVGDDDGVVAVLARGLVAWVLDGPPGAGPNMEDFFEGNECG